MAIVNEELLAEFRRKPQCEYCHKRTRTGLDPHHIFSRGAGRVDDRYNLIALCRVCHVRFHGGLIRRGDLLAIVARREGVTPESCEQHVYDMRRQRSENIGETDEPDANFGTDSETT